MDTVTDHDDGLRLLSPEELVESEQLLQKLSAACAGHNAAVISQAMLNIVAGIARGMEQRDPEKRLPIVLAELVYQWVDSLSTGDAMNFWDYLEELTDRDDELPEGQFEN